MTVSVWFARKAYSVCLLSCTVTSQAIPRKDTLGDAQNCHDLEEEMCSGAKQVYLLPDRMPEYEVSWQIPVSNEQFLQLHVSSCITGML